MSQVRVVTGADGDRRVRGWVPKNGTKRPKAGARTRAGAGYRRRFADLGL